MESTAGLTLVALFVLWLGFLVPDLIRHHTVLAGARVDDRFSGGLRVVAVIGGTTTDARRGGAMTTGTGGSHLTGARPAVPSRGMPPAPRVPDDVESPEQRRLLAERRARRAARARRRFVLSLLLFVSSAATAVLAALGTVHWVVAAVPAVLLLAVLVQGRRAAVEAGRAEGAVEAARRVARQRATQARALANGGPYAPRNRMRVTGGVVRKDGVLDELMTSPVPARAKVVDQKGAPATEGPDETATREAGIGGEAWDPVPVPLPTYVTKPAARQLPAGTAATARPAPAAASGADAAARSAEDEKAARLAAAMRASAGIPTGETPAVVPGDATGEATVRNDPAPASSSAGTVHPDEDELMRPAPRVRDETLAQPLDQILARRRAAG